MNDNLFVVIAISAVFYGTPLLFAALGEIITERSGVLNLGVEGMMLMGGATAAYAGLTLGGPGWLVLILSILAGAVAGALTALIHAVLVLTFRVDQTVSGLAITLMCGAAGLSSWLANSWEIAKTPVPNRLSTIAIPLLSDIPVLGPILFKQNALTYLGLLLVVGVSWFLFRTRWGLHLRAVGEAPATADAMGVNVLRTRYLATMTGGAFAGVAGAFFPLAVVSLWTDGITGGLGWIAIALVIFGFWRPDLALVGAVLFGGFGRLSFTLQARGVDVPTELLNSLPYLMTVIVLVAVSSGWARKRVGAPAALGKSYEREAR